MATQSKEALTKLSATIKGRVLGPDDSGYDEARQIWNAMIDRRPAVIVQPANGDDVAPAIKFARENALEISVRGAGHNIAGNAICNGGLTIDFSQMKQVRVDTANKRAYVDAGATLGDLDAATQRHGLATPVGINSTTGIAGLTLGGGFGWLTRKHGMTIDNLVSADVITADGKKLPASEQDNPELFWALRGGGGNFGIVTQFEFALHPVGPEILAGLLVFPFAQAKQILTRYRQFASAAPEDLSVWVVLRQAPPLPFLPQDVHGKEVLVLPIFYAGGATEGQRLIDELRAFGNPHGEHVGAQPYAEWQKAFDPLLTAGARNYWKSHNFTELSDGAIDVIIEYAGKLPSPQ
jgi:FAD/FMN-containing dehydrogenase